MEEVIGLVMQFREAIEIARYENEFREDICFGSFPLGCCGDTSDLLAHYLLKHDIETYYICGNYYGDNEGYGQSHAWLELSDGTIIDITGDQFKYNDIFMNYSIPVYVGEKDEFHAMFDVDDRDIRKGVALEYLGEVCYPRLKCLYDIISKYILLD